MQTSFSPQAAVQEDAAGQALLTGRIVSALGGFYDVCTASHQQPIRCRARGLFRKTGLSPCVGDLVTVQPQEENTGYLMQILPRKNQLVRPPLANLDWLFLVVSSCDPAPNLLVLDKLIALAEYQEITPAIVVTKTDRDPAGRLIDCYTAAGFSVFPVASPTGRGIDALYAAMAGKISAFCGNSGVGKSSILNAIDPQLGLLVGDTSKKLGRGRHTTRHCQLYRLQNGGMIADTPGFSSLELEGALHIPKEQLAYCFREFAPYLQNCRFTGCSHTCEKGCAVLQAVGEGHISAQRHESYREIYNQVKNFKEWEQR